MKCCSEVKDFVPWPGRVIIECVCGERLVLLGLEEDWRSRDAVFGCQCGEKLTAAVKQAVRGRRDYKGARLWA